jgi:hypothetical protein
MKKLIFFLIFLFLSAGSAGATTVTFQQGVSSYTGSHAGKMSSTNTNEIDTAAACNPGDGYIGINSGYETLLYFDVSSIPSTATINSATIYLYLDESNCTSETLNFKKVKDPNASGIPNFPATENCFFNTNADWLYKDDNVNLKWDTSGTNFTDVNNDVTEGSISQAACPGYAQRSTTITNMVAYWVANPTKNAGFIVGCVDSCNVIMKSPFNSTSSNRPRLVVDYTAAGGGTTRRVMVIQ